MAGLIDLVRQELSGNGIQQLSNHIGADPATTLTGVTAALPAVLNGMAQRAQQPGGETAIHQAIDAHAGLLGSLAALAGHAPTQTPGGLGVLDHIFGDDHTQIQNTLSQTTGLAPDQSHKMLAVLAPLVLAALAHQRSQGQMPVGGLSQLLQSQTLTGQQSGIGGILGQILGR
jgi:hypothetical protein